MFYAIKHTQRIDIYHSLCSSVGCVLRTFFYHLGTPQELTDEQGILSGRMMSFLGMDGWFGYNALNLSSPKIPLR